MRKNSSNSFGADVSRICATFLVRLKAASKHKKPAKRRSMKKGTCTKAMDQQSLRLLHDVEAMPGRIVFGFGVRRRENVDVNPAHGSSNKSASHVSK